MDEIFSSLSLEMLILFGTAFFLIFILLLMNISSRRKIQKLKEKYNKFMNGFGEVNMEQLLERCIDNINKVGEKNREIELHINNLERNLIQCVQKVAVVRYNAFDDVGSDLSFSVAMLNSNDDGIVLSSIYSRDSSISYAKPVIGAKSKYTLSAEEIQAIEMARKSNR